MSNHKQRGKWRSRHRRCPYCKKPVYTGARGKNYQIIENIYTKAWMVCHASCGFDAGLMRKRFLSDLDDRGCKTVLYRGLQF
jgi:hypothetical protein